MRNFHLGLAASRTIYALNLHLQFLVGFEIFIWPYAAKSWVQYLPGVFDFVGLTIFDRDKIAN